MTKMVRDALCVVVTVNFFYLVSDYFLYPEHLLEFALVRAGLVLISAFLFFRLAFTHPVAAEISGCLATGAMLLVLTYWVGGMTSSYYTGLAILFAGMPILVPLSWRQTAAIEITLVGVLSLSPWVLAARDSILALPTAASPALSSALLTPAVDWALYVGNLCFLIATVAVSVSASLILDELRFQDFCQRRALAVARDELGEKNQALEASAREIELLTRAVYHDLRSPLAAANEALKVARSFEGAAAERFFALAHESLQRADAMAVGLREMLRTMGRHETRSAVSLDALLAKLRAELYAAHPGANFTIELASELGVALGEPAKLDHLFRNLLANAVLHAARDTARLTIGVESTLHGDEVQIAVRDDGCGIPYPYQARIFEPFRRGPERSDSQSTLHGVGQPPECKVSPGTGLGLALVKQIVEQHGGKVFLDSAPGRGSTFRVSLPRAPHPACADASHKGV